MFTPNRVTLKRVSDLQTELTSFSGQALCLETNMRNRVSVWTAEMKTNEGGFTYALPQRQLTEYLSLRECYAWLSGAINVYTGLDNWIN